MDINAFNALKTYGTAQRAFGAENPSQKAESGGQGEFKPMNVAKDFVATIAKSEQTAAAFMTGNADPHSVVEAIASAELAVETAVTLRNRVVEAYQELLRMPI